MDLKQIKAIENSNKERWIKHFGWISDDSGIYILTREEDGFRYAYIGQAKHILTRLAHHLRGYQYIDKSIRKHGLFSNENPYGWNLKFSKCELHELDLLEQYFVKEYANNGYQLRNITAGGQGKGKFEIAESKPKKTYRDGLKQGYLNAQRDISKLFQTNLACFINGKPNKNKEKALEKFMAFIKGENDGRT